MGTTVTVAVTSDGRTIQVVEKRANEWIRRRSGREHLKIAGDTLQRRRNGRASMKIVADTLQSVLVRRDEFGYRIIRRDSSNSAVFDVEQSFLGGGYFGGLNARLLAYYMATGVDFDTSRIRSTPALTSYYVQLGGEGVMTSFNVERLMFPNIIARAGVGYSLIALSGAPDGGVTIPVGASWISGHDNGVEVGVGATLVTSLRFAPDDDEILGFISIGYRRFPIEGGTVFRAVFTPMFSFNRGEVDLGPPLFGFGFGHTF